MKFAKVTAEEAKANVASERHLRVDLTPYVEFFGTLDWQNGEQGRIELEPNEKKAQVKRHIEMAAQSVELDASFFTSGTDVIKFALMPLTDERKAEIKAEYETKRNRWQQYNADGRRPARATESVPTTPPVPADVIAAAERIVGDPNRATVK